MDPLTITISTLTLITSVKKTLELLRKLHRTSQALDALIQETSDLALVFQHVEAFLRTLKSNPPDGAEPEARDLGLLPMLERARSTVSEIEDLAKIHVGSKGSTSRFKSLRNSAKVLSQLNSKRQDLQTVRFNLNNILLVVSS